MIKRTLTRGILGLLLAAGGPLVGGPLAAQTDVTDPEGNVLTHVHDSEGRLVGATDRLGHQLTIVPDATGRRAAEVDRTGALTTYAYDPESGDLATVSHPDGTETALAFESRTVHGLTVRDPVQLVLPDGNTLDWIRDANGHPLTLIDPTGQSWTATYDSRGRWLTATNPLGGVRSRVIDAGDGTVTSVTDAAGDTTTYGYDGFLRLTSVTHPGGAPSRSFSWDDADRLTGWIDEEGGSWAIARDLNGNPTGRTDPLGHAWTRAYDSNERSVAITDPLGETTALTWTTRGRVGAVTDRSTRTWTFGHDAENRWTSIQEPGGATWTRTLDEEGRPTALTNPLGETTTIGRDVMGRVTSVTTDPGDVWTFQLDPLGRRVGTTDPLGRQATITRDAAGRPVGFTAFGGTPSVALGRDAAGLVTSFVDGNGESWLFGRDAAGRVTSFADPLGRTVTVTYDSRSRPASLELPARGTETATFTWDGLNRLVQASYPGTVLDWTWDAAGRLGGGSGLSTTWNDADQLIESNGLLLGRDEEGRLTSVEYAPGKVVTYTYDANGRLATLSDWIGGTTTFTYDAAGRRTGVVRPNGTQATYTWDSRGLLVGITETGPGGPIFSVTLERDTRGLVTSAVRELPYVAPFTPRRDVFAYDAASQVVGYAYDELGRRIGDDRTFEYGWDGAGRLALVDPTSAAGDEVFFTHDAFGRRTSRTEDGVTVELTWNDGLGFPQIAMEMPVTPRAGSEGAPRSRGAAVARNLLHQPDGRLFGEVVDPGGGEEIRFFIFDERGHRVASTDGTGAIASACDYRPDDLLSCSDGAGARGEPPSRSGTRWSERGFDEVERRTYLAEDGWALEGDLASSGDQEVDLASASPLAGIPLLVEPSADTEGASGAGQVSKIRSLPPTAGQPTDARALWKLRRAGAIVLGRPWGKSGAFLARLDSLRLDTQGRNPYSLDRNPSSISSDLLAAALGGEGLPAGFGPSHLSRTKTLAEFDWTARSACPLPIDPATVADLPREMSEREPTAVALVDHYLGRLESLEADTGVVPQGDGTPELFPFGVRARPNRFLDAGSFDFLEPSPNQLDLPGNPALDLQIPSDPGIEFSGLEDRRGFGP